MKKTLTELITEAAKTNIGRFNFMKDVTEKEVTIKHHRICKEIVNISTEEGFPIPVLVYIGVGTNAHKPSVFEKKYSRFKKERALEIISFNKLFAERFGAKWFGNDKIVHLLSRYHDLGGTTEHLVSAISKIEVTEINGNKFDSAKKIGNVLFKDTASFAKCGFIRSLKNSE